MTETVRAKDLRPGDVVDLHSGLDFRKDSLTRVWRTLLCVAGTDPIELTFENHASIKASPDFKYERQK